MYLHADRDDCSNLEVIDLRTNLALQGIVWANDTVGIYMQYRHRINRQGVIEWFYRNGHLVPQRKTGAIRIMKKDN